MPDTSSRSSLKTYLAAAGVEVVDYGCDSPDPVDYPDVALRSRKDIAANKAERGILICGTGIGMAIAANKVPGRARRPGARSLLGPRARKSNNAQIITLGARVIAPELAKTIVDVWLASEFEGGNSARKVGQDRRLRRHPRSRARPSRAPDPETP
jgi:ribose 5-phosphate isomerase B